MNANQNPTTPSDVVIIPDDLSQAIGKANEWLTKESDAIAKAQRVTVENIGGPAQKFAQQLDAFATANAADCQTKSGRIKFGPTLDMIRNAQPGLLIAGNSTYDRLYNIGRAIPSGEVAATLATFQNAHWMQPSNALAPNGVAEERTNAMTIKDYNSWCRYRFNMMTDADKAKFVMVDDVLLRVEDHARLTADYVAPDAEDTGTEDTEPDDNTSDDAASHEEATVSAAPSNQVNTGALAAVFTSCDDDTVNSAITVDVSQYETVEELTALALSALATATLMQRNAAVKEEAAA